MNSTGQDEGTTEGHRTEAMPQHTPTSRWGKGVALAAGVLLCQAETYTINSMQDFWAMKDKFEAATTLVQADVELRTDLSFAAQPLQYPLACSSSTVCQAWSGTLAGNGHRVEHLTVPLFGVIEGAVVEGVVFDESCHVEAPVAAMLAQNATDLQLTEVTNHGSIKGSKVAGGLVGYLHGTNTLQRCENFGKIESLCQGGGCHIGGLCGQVRLVAGTPNNLTKVLNSHNAGDCFVHKRGDLSQISIGGLLGNLYKMDLVLENCTNTGNLIFGGGVGYSEVFMSGSVGGLMYADVILKSFMNLGEIKSPLTQEIGNSFVHGILGHPIDWSATHENYKVYNCLNSGKLEGVLVYGVTESVTKAHNVVNKGAVHGTYLEVSTWADCVGECTSVYQVVDTCQEVGDVVKEGGVYYLCDGHTPVVDTLNQQVQNQSYGVKWLDSLLLDMNYPQKSGCPHVALSAFALWIFLFIVI